MKRLLVPLAAVVALFVVGMPVARAAAIEISINTVVKAPEGSITVLATTDTPPDLIGRSCVGVAEAINQPSVHPGNDLIVTSGDDSIVLEDVEREPGAVTTAEVLLTLGPTVTVSLRMGPDETFSGGLVFTIDECPPPTTTTESPTTTTESPTTTTESPTTTTESPTTTTESPTTTTESPTTTTESPLPAIVIEKLADPVEYGNDGIGHFTIRVTNPGPVDLTDVRVTDDIALAVDPASKCPTSDIPDLAVGESHEYDCTVANLDGVSPFMNEATAIGKGPDGSEVIDTDDAVVFPPVLATTITQAPPTTAPSPTLPNTGVPFAQVRFAGVAGLAFVLGGIALLSAAAAIGRLGVQQTGISAQEQHEVWLTIEIRPIAYTIYIPLRPAGSDPGSQIN